jgi:tripartite-type tricarboxylate transporter receptor subunit TctC
LNAIVATPEFREAMDKNGAEPISNTPEQFATLISQEADRYGKVVKALGIKLD